jgi:hypothetical protein
VAKKAAKKPADRNVEERRLSGGKVVDVPPAPVPPVTEEQMMRWFGPQVDIIAAKVAQGIEAKLGALRRSPATSPLRKSYCNAALTDGYQKLERKDTLDSIYSINFLPDDFHTARDWSLTPQHLSPQIPAHTNPKAMPPKASTADADDPAFGPRRESSFAISSTASSFLPVNTGPQRPVPGVRRRFSADSTMSAGRRGSNSSRTDISSIRSPTGNQSPAQGSPPRL